MKWIQFNNRTWRRAFIYVALSVLLFGIQFYIWPSVRLLAQEWQQARLQDDQLFKVRQKTGELEQKFASDTSVFEQVSAIAPKEEHVAQLIERLENVAQTERVSATIQGISHETGEKIRPVVFTVQATGQPSALLNYMSALENLSELSAIRSWSLSSTTPKSINTVLPATVYALSLNIIFYLQTAS